MLRPDEIQHLIAAGAHADAARALEEAGALEEAQRLFEKIWDFAQAARLAERRGDRPEQLRLALEAKDLPQAARVGAQIAASTDEERARAAAIYERKRMWPEAARLREALGDLEAARALYARAGLFLDEARLDEALGRPREAGQAYERALAEDPDGEGAARAEAGAGRVLASFGRHEEAVRRLQRALKRIRARAPGDDRDRELGLECAKQLVVELAALGFAEGARGLLDELRAEDPRIEALDPFLQRRARRAVDAGAEPMLGGRYRVERLLGSGGMGRVYLAVDQSVGQSMGQSIARSSGATGRRVAVKVVAPPLDARARDGWARFVREARVVAGLHHPNLVAVLDFHEELGLLVMEYMAGGTLAERLAAGPLPPHQVRAVLSQIGAGLAAAHARGVIHRDIKPANVFFTATREAKLGDFGVAHLQDLGATQTGGFIGTLAYMAPEQITGARLTYACDLYALGVSAFQMLTGRLPFPGPDFVGQHLGQVPPPVSARAPRAAPFDALVARLLAKDPAERFATIDELQRALDALRLPEPGLAAAGPAARAGAPERAAEPERTPGDEARYRLEAEIEGGRGSTIFRGVDERLGRPVLVERFAPGVADGAGGDAGLSRLAWLRAMARHGGPRLQRVLRIERLPDGATRAVYEAPLGAPPGRLDRAGAARLVLETCRALAGPHADGVAHGAIDGSLVFEEPGPTLLVAGRAPADGATPAGDLTELMALARRLAGDEALADAPGGEPELAGLAAWARRALAGA
jgi:serine/threonine-protein kinase